MGGATNIKRKRKEYELDERGFLADLSDLKASYRATYWRIRHTLKELDEQDPDTKLLRDARSDVLYVIQWLHTGRRPGNRRGIERRAAYQREKLMDPLKMQAMMASSTAGSPANISESDRERIEMALCTLSPRERECYEMAHGQGFSFAYIANLLGISKGAVQEYVERAQEKVSEEVRNNMFLRM